jgi:hypothetical protein
MARGWLQRRRSPNHMGFCDKNAVLAGTALAVAVAVGIFVGSVGLRHFDPAVTLYAVGAVLAAFAVGYRFAV